MVVESSAPSSAELPPSPPWRGVNHLALVTPDMDATVRFYTGVLGMPLVMTLMAGPMRHYFFEIAPHNTIAFFEIAGAETFAKGAGSPAPHPVQMDHISLNLDDEAALETLRGRLLAAECEVTDVVDHGVLRSVYFSDNNGIALEATWWVDDGTGRPFDPDDADLFQDPDPVPAIAELAGGSIGALPRTRLV
ncbi:MAG: VOC family protein [Ilumatobacter sp.]|nr:VOC family protein [Ilumatobacter sp.]